MIKWDRKTKIKVLGALEDQGLVQFILNPEELSPSRIYIQIYGRWYPVSDILILEVLHTYRPEPQEPVKRGLLKRIWFSREVGTGLVLLLAGIFGLLLGFAIFKFIVISF